MAFATGLSAMKFLVSLVLSMRRPRQVTGVNARKMTITAEVRHFMPRRWLRAMNCFTDSPMNRDLLAADPDYTPAISAFSIWPQEAIVPDMGYRLMKCGL